ncbi:LPS export ABC transporter permease LptG [Gilliamella sp. B14448G11]|uniref:LPS export ABC transporter permease LptG n=1 Tax=unclassified Gilliamella TaxID=2685620 RepID=UPI0018DDE1D2|nr:MULTISPECIES: LPS export ABC transporter permease LptG [unclassified Gilliamella]MBI0028678.1 LPS export ABC transporter permease LptG [Gilliamella sp. B14448G7]MBI0031662.1 LPS export ABC transporter permease LptG [Gilliamella sp. B14384G15]MBI0035365.1 LPS export ABC transporter permease LptG [Gilliamella sp. B14448G11]MBI0042602.1 LPS export ABC transporter permease LptG [Gilliamella sp. B14448G12]MBI0059017.1 LPS export ABC transporter permease LptG [Gilliamella sp. B14384G12]
MFSILDRYIGKTIISTIGISLFLLISLSGIIRFIDQLRRIKVDYDAFAVGIYSLLMAPKDLEVFFPMAALLGALIGLGLLASRSELIVMETAGFSRFKIALAVMKTALPLVLITMAIGEWVAPVSEQTARNMRSEKLYGSSLMAQQGSLWAKDGNDYIYIGHINSDSSISNIDIYSVDNNKLLSITHADNGIFKDNVWTLSQIEKSDLTQIDKIQTSNILSMEWKTNITPDKLSVVAFDPDSLSASGLYKYSQYLKSSGQDTRNYDLLFWKKLIKPLSVAVMMLLALSFIFGPLRSVSMGVRVIIGISFGFIFYIADNLFAQASIVIGIYPIIGSMLTSIVFLLISYILFKRKN